MKLFNTITACLLLCAGLVSCEMKDELKGSGAGTSEVGYLNLGVAVNASQNSVVSRADDVTDDGKNENVGVSVSADEFPVTIIGVTDPSYSKEYESYAALKAENGGKVELPIGEYTVTAHSNAELKPQMATPYYEGTTPIKITAGVESSAEVKCTMKNMKIQLTYAANFLTKFESWYITISAGNNTLEFDDTDKNPAAVYWLVAENVTEIKVDITATPTGGGQPVPDSRVLSKPDGSNWAGSDALTIQMEENTSDDPTGIQGSGITINASVSFDEDSEDVPVTVKPGGGSSEEPEEPGTGGEEDEPEKPQDPELPTITINQLSYTLPDNLSDDAIAVIKSSVGLESVKVQIVPDNQMFGGMLQGVASVYQIDFLSGAELVDEDNLANVVAELAPGLEAPNTGDKEYEFPVDAFFEALNNMGLTLTDGHKFNIVVQDSNGTAESSLSVIVNAAN